MRQELENIREKYNRITASLADPAVSSNPQRIKQLAKERAELDPVVRGYDRFQKIEQEIGESEEILNEMQESDIPHLRKERLLGEDALLLNRIALKLGAPFAEMKVAGYHD